jgi:transglutaminase-like putative cysteine protease
LPRLSSLAAFLAAVAGLGVLIARFLPWAQPLVEAATASLVSPPASTGYAGFSLTSRLGDIEELALSRRVVLRAYTDTPQRLRGRAFTRFDGRAWSAEPARGAVDLLATNPAALPPPLPGFFEDLPGAVFSLPAQAAGSPPLVRTRIVSSLVDVEAVLAPLTPVFVSLPKDGARLDDQGILTASPPGPVEIYGIVNRPGGPRAGRAEDATLQLPAALDPRTVALAESLGGRGGAPEERVRRTLHHLERCCRYSLKAPRTAARDVVAGFLFETQRGYCEYFASAAALLLRLQGVPTRYVTGFNVRDESVVAGHYVVRESDAHAWIESHVPGQGWLEFDPTPSAQYSELHSQADGGALAALLERWKALASEASVRMREGSLPKRLRWLARAAAPLGALLALALVAWLFRRGSARGAAPAAGAALPLDPRVQELLVRVDRLTSARGHPRPPARAPQEHLETLPETALEAALRAEAASAVRCFYRARYGGEHPAAQEVDELLRRLPTA